MSKVSIYKIDRKEKNKIVDELFDAISGLKSRKEVFDFLVGLLTESETLMIGRRIQIAKMLLENKTYSQIAKKLRVSHVTTGHVDKWIREDGRMELIAKKLGKHVERTYAVPRHTGSLLDKYHRRGR